MRHVLNCIYVQGLPGNYRKSAIHLQISQTNIFYCIEKGIKKEKGSQWSKKKKKTNQISFGLPCSLISKGNTKSSTDERCEYLFKRFVKCQWKYMKHIKMLQIVSKVFWHLIFKIYGAWKCFVERKLMCLWSNCIMRIWCSILIFQW